MRRIPIDGSTNGEAGGHLPRPSRSTASSNVQAPALAFAWLLAVSAACGRSEASGRELRGRRKGGRDREQVVHLPIETLREFGVKVTTAGPGILEAGMDLPGEIVPDPARVVHVTPRIPGVVQEVFHTLGDEVRRGERLAVLSSRRLADLVADLMVARAEASLARQEFARERRLYKRGVSSQKEFATARARLRKAYVQVEAARSRLFALGLGRAQIDELVTGPARHMARYVLRAPADGIVVSMHISRGERLEADSQAFTIADLTRVWAELKVYQRDLARLQIGQPVVVRARYGGLRVRSRIDYVAPLVGRATRTATARVVLDNELGQWRPGVFVTGRVVLERKKVRVLVPKTAVQVLGGRVCIFVQTGRGFACRTVALGLSNHRFVEVRSGLEPGTRYVADGGFLLKSELEKASSADHGH